MAITVASVQDKIQRRFPDMSDALALEYINAAHQDILRQLPLITATEDIAPVAGTQEYAINESTIRILAAEWVTSATDRRPLAVTDIDYLNKEEPGWRRIGSGSPTRFYMYRSATDNVVGVIPKPVNSQSSGYPIIRLHVTRVETLTGASSLPKSVLTMDLWVYEAQLRFALDNRTYQDEVPMLKSLRDEAMAIERKVFEQRHPYRRRIGLHGIGMGGVS